MKNILKMDIKRIFYSKSFYISIIIMSIMAFSVAYSQMSTTLEGVLGIASGVNAGDDFMTTMTGTGLLNILLSIILSIFICGDYSSGMAKNIFSFHSNKLDYILGRTASMSIVSAIFIFIYMIESVIALYLFSPGFTFTASILGMITFFVEKWLSSCALISIITLVCCYTRHTAWGIFAGFLVATGGLTMGLMVISNILSIPTSLMSTIISFTVSGSSKLVTLNFSIMELLKVGLVSMIWFGICSFMTHKILLRKDI